MEKKVRLLIEKHKEDKDLTSEKDHIEPGWDWSKVDLKDWKLELLNLSNKENRADLRGAHLEGANLMDVNLERVDLRGAHLEGTVLMEAHLEGAVLWEAHLKGAILREAHLEGADLKGAHLEGADLKGAYLEGTDLKGVHLEGADFRDAKLINTNLSYSFLEKTLFSENTLLNDIQLLHADLKNSYLKRAHTNIDEVVIEEREGQFRNAKEIYLSLKNYFRDVGMYDISGKYYYREMLMARKLAWSNAKSFKWDKKEIFKSFKRLSREWTGWFVSKMMDLLTGYGEKPTRVMTWWIGLVSVFGAIYYLFKGIMDHPNAFAYMPSPLESIYFSVVSFTTLGFGDFQPKPGIFQIVASIEAFLGALFIALFLGVMVILGGYFVKKWSVILIFLSILRPE